MDDSDAAFGVRQLAAAFSNGATRLKAIKSGSKLPHSKANPAQNGILLYTFDDTLVRRAFDDQEREVVLHGAFLAEEVQGIQNRRLKGCRVGNARLAYRFL